MFTLFSVSLFKGQVDVKDKAERYLFSVYFLSYVILNVFLLINLIVAQLVHAYQKYNKNKKVLYLLTTLSVREVSEAD